MANLSPQMHTTLQAQMHALQAKQRRLAQAVQRKRTQRLLAVGRLVEQAGLLWLENAQLVQVLEAGKHGCGLGLHSRQEMSE